MCGHLTPSTPTHRPHCNSRAGAWGRPGDPWDPLGVPRLGQRRGTAVSRPSLGAGNFSPRCPHNRGACAVPARGSLSLLGSLRARPPEARRPLTILQMEAMFRTVISLKVAAIAHRHLYQGKTGLSMVARSEAGWRRGGLGPACSGVGRGSEAGRRRGRGGGAGRGVAERRSRGRGRREEEPGAGRGRTGAATTLPPPARTRSANPAGSRSCSSALGPAPCQLHRGLRTGPRTARGTGHWPIVGWGPTPRGH